MSNIIYLAVGCLVLAVIFGFIVFVQLACERPSFKPVVWLHGIFALLGLGCILYYVGTHPGSGPVFSAIVLTLAALGGATLFMADIRQKPVSKIILFLHPLIALIGFGLLIAYVIFL